MKKRLNFVLSFLLILAIAAGVLAVPAASYENDVLTSSVAMLLLNLDTDTSCYALRENGKWYAGNLSEAVTFMIALQNLPDPKSVRVQVTREFISGLPYSDGCLDRFVGYTLTAEDLLAIMMLTPGSDAAYLIAETVSPGNLTGFVAMMNRKVADLGCSSTRFVSPGYSESKEHVTTCTDMSKIYKALGIIDLYNRIMESPVYTPDGFDEDRFAVVTDNSILNPDSPFYFRYATGGKYSFSKYSGANLMVTTTYRGKTYLFIALRGKYATEQSVFVDAKRLTTWAYLNLSDRKVIDADKEVASYRALASWGGYDVSLLAGGSAYKTLPNTFEQQKLSYKISVPESVTLPVFEGQSIGTAKIYYDGQKIDDITLVSSVSEGVSLLRDIARLGHFAMDGIMSADPSPAGADETVSPAEPQTEPAEPSAGASSPTSAAAVTEAEG